MKDIILDNVPSCHTLSSQAPAIYTALGSNLYQTAHKEFYLPFPTILVECGVDTRIHKPPFWETWTLLPSTWVSPGDLVCIEWSYCIDIDD
jgi:hypothetical protein